MEVKSLSKMFMNSVRILLPVIFIIMIVITTIFAVEVALDTSKNYRLDVRIAEIIQNIGAVVMFIGVLNLSLVYKSESPNMKAASVKTAAVGALIMAVAKAYTVFFI